MHGVRKMRHCALSIHAPVWFHTTHCFTKHAYWAECTSQKALMHSYRVSCLSIQSLHMCSTSIHPLLLFSGSINISNVTVDYVTIQSLCSSEVVRGICEAEELISNAAERSQWQPQRLRGLVRPCWHRECLLPSGQQVINTSIIQGNPWKALLEYASQARCPLLHFCTCVFWCNHWYTIINSCCV